MQDDKTTPEQEQDQTTSFEQTSGVNITQPHKHNPFEDKQDELTKEEEDAIEQFKEAQTERD